MGGSAPPPADYAAAAKETAAGDLANLNAQTVANRPNQYTPFGSSEWTQGPDGTWTQDVRLTGAQQGALDDQMAIQSGRSGAALGMLPQVMEDTSRGIDWGALPAMSGGIRGAEGVRGDIRGADGLQGRLDYSGAPVMPDATSGLQRSVAGAGDAARNAAEDALYNRASTRLDKRFGQQEGNLEAQLRNQGLNPGDEAYDRAMSNLGDTKNDAYSSAMWDAIGRGGEEQSRQFGMNLESGQFGNAAQEQGFQQGMAARQQGVGETNAQGSFLNQALMQGQQMDQTQADFWNRAQQQGQQMEQNQGAFQNQLRQQALGEQQLDRNFTLNQLNALLSGQQVSNPQFGGFSNAGVTRGPDLLGAAGMQDAANLNSYSAQQQAAQGWLSGAAGLAGAGLSFLSDERLKTDVRRYDTEIAPGIPLALYRWKRTGKLEVGVIAQDVERVRPDAVVEQDGFKRVVYGKLAPGFAPVSL